MQKFDDLCGRRRILDISNLKVEEVEDYYLQETNVSEESKKQKIEWLQAEIKSAENQKITDKWILAIKSKNKKIIGMIKVWEVEPEQAFVKVSIPNKNWVSKYGKEALDQFIKICREKKYFSVIEFESDNSIVDQYINMEQNRRGKSIGYKITIA